MAITFEKHVTLEGLKKIHETYSEADLEIEQYEVDEMTDSSKSLIVLVIERLVSQRFLGVELINKTAHSDSTFNWFISNILPDSLPRYCCEGKTLVLFTKVYSE